MASALHATSVLQKLKRAKYGSYDSKIRHAHPTLLQQAAFAELTSILKPVKG